MHRADRKLAQRVIAGDARAATTFTQQYQREVFNLFMWLTRDPELAEDLTQDTIVRCWERLPQYRGEAALRTWVHRVALRLLAAHKRSGAQEARACAQLAQFQAAESPGRAYSHLELRLALADALANLPDTERHVVVLCKLQGFTLAEAGAMLDQPAGTVAWHIVEGLKKLRALLADYAPDSQAVCVKEVSADVSDRTQAARPE